MASDFSRVRFDPSRNYSGVLQQQGRLALDADFNEYVAILDRRLRSTVTDLTSMGPNPGQAGTAWVPRQTPDAFEISLSGSQLLIGRGRMYVDGLVAENHGRPPTAWDPLLAEETGTTDTPYNLQPFWPTPDALPATGRHLVYLDVWQREVTHLQEPDLVEPAVGVDTTSRLQTAWRVRVLPNVGQATCATDDAGITGWAEAIRPSGGRLTTGTIDVDDDDPCELPPSGGYRGLENQTYRVEIHAGGAPGTATFKWSRDNGSVAMPVVEMVSPTTLRLASVGKDEVLRIKSGDWVEIVDDHYELAGRPGEIRRVTVDDAARTITYSGAIPADLRPADSAAAAARHLRVRRWDQAGPVRNASGTVLVDLDQPGAPGVIKVPTSAATKVVLEHGLTVKFSAAGGGVFRPGDHWIFAARVAEPDPEPLVNAPPLGIHHHYARLAIIDMGAGTVSDCRRQWPPIAEGGEGCCTVSVGDGSTSTGDFSVIQEAVDHVAGQGGGRVCVLPGDHRLDGPVTIESDDITVAGCGLGSRITAPEGEPAIVVRGAQRVNLQAFMALSTSRDATIRVLASSEVEIRDCAVGNSVSGAAGDERGVRELDRGRNQRREALGPAVAISEGEGGRSAMFTLEDCVLYGLPAASVQCHQATVRGNRLLGGGAWVSDGSQDVEIGGNDITRGEGPGVLLGGLLLDELPGARTGGLARIEVSGNRIGGMSGSGVSTWGHFREPQSVLDDRRSGFGSLVTELAVDGNDIRDCANSEFAALFDPEAMGGVVLREVTILRLTDNQILDNGAGGGMAVCGVFLHACVGVDVGGNRISGNAPSAEFELPRGERYQGGLIAPLVTATYDEVGEPGRGGFEGIEIRIPERRQWAAASSHALRLENNTIISPRGHALLVNAVGSVSVADSLLACHDIVEQPNMGADSQLPLNWLGVCFRIVNLGMGLDSPGVGLLGRTQEVLLREGIPLDGRVLVHGNQMQFQIPDGSPFFDEIREHGPGAAVGLLSNDDVSFQDNQVMFYARPTLG